MSMMALQTLKFEDLIKTQRAIISGEGLFSVEISKFIHPTFKAVLWQK